VAMKKFLLTGFGPATTEENIQSWLGEFGPVVDVEIIRDGNATLLVAFVEMDIGDEQALHLTSRFNNFRHEGHRVNVWRVLP
jgi:hypothetical protein